MGPNAAGARRQAAASSEHFAFMPGISAARLNQSLAIACDPVAMRVNLTILAFVAGMIVAFDYFALNARYIHWLLRSAEETGTQFKDDVNDFVGRHVRHT
jgi:hypothetical protein